MNKITRKYGKRRIFLICYCFFSLLLIAEILILFNLYNTMQYKGNTLRVEEVHSDGVVMRDQNENTLTLAAITQSDDEFAWQQTIQYLTETITYRYAPGADSRYIFSDGSTYTEPWIQVSHDDESQDDSLSPLQTEEKQLVNRLRDYFLDYQGAGLYAGLALVGLVLLLLAHGVFFYPEVFWHLQTALSVRGGEPTDFYLFMNKLSSFFILAMVYIGLAVIL